MVVPGMSNFIFIYMITSVQAACIYKFARWTLWAQHHFDTCIYFIVYICTHPYVVYYVWCIMCIQPQAKHDTIAKAIYSLELMKIYFNNGLSQVEQQQDSNTYT